MSESEPIGDQVCIVDDDASICLTLKALVESEGFTARTFDSAEALLAGLDQHGGPPPVCLLLDVQLPGASGMQLLEQWPRRQPTTPVILVSAYADVPQAVAAMRCGALDVIEKPIHSRDLLARLHDAVALHRQRSREQEQSRTLQQRYESLSPREQQVMALVVRGVLNKQIATELGLSPKTVECHRARVMEKMEAASLADLVRAAVMMENRGLIQSQSPPSASSAN